MSGLSGLQFLSLCAHAVAVSLGLQRLETYLKWLVTKHRKTGGVSYSSAITDGMPRSRGRKPNQAPRKRGGRRKYPSTDNVKTFPSPGLTEDRQSYPQAFAQSTPFSESIFQFNNNGQANYLKEQPYMSAPNLGQAISLPIPISQPMPTQQRMPISQTDRTNEVNKQFILWLCYVAICSDFAEKTSYETLLLPIHPYLLAVYHGSIFIINKLFC